MWKGDKYTDAQKDAIKAERRSRGKQQPSPGKKWMKKAKKAMKTQGKWKKERKEMTARIVSLEANNQTNGDDSIGSGGGGGANGGRPPYAAPNFQRS